MLPASLRASPDGPGSSSCPRSTRAVGPSASRSSARRPSSSAYIGEPSCAQASAWSRISAGWERAIAVLEPSQPVLLEDPPPDDHPLDVGRALTDEQHRSLPVEPLDLVLLGEAVAAVDPEGVLYDLGAVLGREVLGHPGLEVVALAPVLDPCGLDHHR